MVSVRVVKKEEIPFWRKCSTWVDHLMPTNLAPIVSGNLKNRSKAFVSMVGLLLYCNCKALEVSDTIGTEINRNKWSCGTLAPEAEKPGAIVLNQNSNNGAKISPVLRTGLIAFLPPCFFLWIRFFLCWAFLLSRLILSGFNFLFRHRFKFKISELLTRGCSVFLPVLACCLLRSGNRTASG